MENPSGMTIKQAPAEVANEHTIQFSTADEKAILIIKADGKLVRGKDFPTDNEASVAFLDCITGIFGGYIDQRYANSAANAETVITAARAYADAYHAMRLITVGDSAAAQRLYKFAGENCGKAWDELNDAVGKVCTNPERS